MKSNAKQILVAIILVAVSGCSNYVKVGGKITFSEDGSPLTTGTVCFQSDSHMARGAVKNDGTYTMDSVKKNDGLPPGTYKVFIADAYRVVGEIPEDREAEVDLLIAEKYTSASRSGWTVEVSQSSRSFDFQVERYVAPPGYLKPKR